MLSNKIICLSFIISLLLLINCSGKKEKPIPKFNFEDKNQVLEIVKNHFDKDISMVFIGNFDNSNQLSVVACAEKMDSINWGIKFYHLFQNNNQIENKYETEILSGSLKESMIDKIKIADKPFELIYYNSLNFFMGSGGGEIYSYIIDFNEKQLYYAHFVDDIEYPASLFISDNAKDLKLRNFIIANFKRDYPNLKIVEKEIKLD